MFDRIMMDTLESSCKTTYELEGTRALSEEQECIVEAMIDTVKLDVGRNALQPSALTSKCTHAEMVAIANIVKFKNGYGEKMREGKTIFRSPLTTLASFS